LLGGIREIVLKEQQHAKIAVRIYIVAIERYNGAEFLRCEIRAVALQVLLRLASIQFDLLLYACV